MCEEFDVGVIASDLTLRLFFVVLNKDSEDRLLQ